ncbi:MAG TPA: hypothetical protein VIM42_04120 [Clostridium sp.]
MKKLSKILSILLMVALLVTMNFDVYAKSRSGGFKSSSSHSSSSSSKSSSSSSSGGFKSSSSYSKPSTATNKSTSTSDVNKSSSNSGTKTPVILNNNNSRSFMPMIFYGNAFSSAILRYAGLVVIILIIFFVYKSIKRKH